MDTEQHYDRYADNIGHGTKCNSTEEKRNESTYDPNNNACKTMTDMNQAAPSTMKAESTNMPSSYSNQLSEQEDACVERNEVSITSEQASNLNCRSSSFGGHEENKTNQSNPTLTNKKPKKLTENEADSF